MKKQILLTIFVVMLLAGAAQASLLVNGGFEGDPGTTGLVNNQNWTTMGSGSPTWDVWQALPGWTTVSGQGIEVQYSGTISGVTAYEGNYYVELDSPRNNQGTGSTNSSMAQSGLTLEVGMTYELSFWYLPRTDDGGDNGINVYLDFDDPGFMDLDLGTADGTRGNDTDWEQYTYTFSWLDIGATEDETYSLIFSATGTANQLGGFIDNVQLTATSAAVPEPSTILLLGVGIAALTGYRFRKMGKQ